MASDKVSQESFELLVGQIGTHMIHSRGYSNELTYSIARLLRSSNRFQAGSPHQRGIILHHLGRGQYNFSLADHGRALSERAVQAFVEAAEGHLGQGQEANLQILLTHGMLRAAVELRNIAATDKASLSVPLVDEKPLPEASAYFLAAANPY